MASDEMFSKFFQYFFLLNGLPIYQKDQNKSSLTLWYMWRISIVMTYNACFTLHTYFMVIKWIYPYTLFAFIDVAVPTFIVGSLIGKHRRLINLQKVITEDLIKNNYSILPSDRCKMKTLQAFFGSVLILWIISLIYGFYRFSELPYVTMDRRLLMYVFVISAESLITTFSNTLFYCIFCKHLMAMFKSINLQVANLDKATTEEKTDVEISAFHRKHRNRKRIKSHECAMTGDSSIFPDSTEYCSRDSRKKSTTLSLPLESKNKVHDTRQGVKSTSSYEDIRRFSCSILESFNKARHPSQFLSAVETDRDDIKRKSSLSKKIQNLNRKFATVSLLVQETDNLFSLQVLTILTIIFLRTCTYIYIYISSDWYKHDSCAKISIMQQVFFDFLAFGSVAMEASLVAEEARKFSPLICSSDGIYRSKSMKVQVQSDVARLTVYAFDVQLTAWKFFTVSRSFMPTVIGVTATYILIIFQLHQIFQDGQCYSSKNATENFLNETLVLSFT